jgi:CubicO group peptidase (beta-lactamase class C family)
MKKIGIVLISVLAILLAFLAWPSNQYLRLVLIHGKADIADYQIFDNRPVKTGIYDPWKMADGFNQKKIPENYLRILENLQTVAFLVVKDSAIVHESYYKGYNEDSYSNSFSVAKSIVSLLVGCALDEGAIQSLDQPVSDFIPEFKNETNSRLTIRQILTMSSGLNWDESYSSPFSVTTKSYYGNNLKALILDLKVVEQPGVRFKYLSGNTQLLAFVVENATHKRLADYASEKLWIPLGASQNALWSIDKKGGDEKAYCCFNTGARNFARIGQLILNKGKWHGKQLLSEKYIREATSPATWLLDESGKRPLDHYGYQWWIASFNGKRVVYARGILGQYIIIVPEKNMVIVRLGEKRCSLRSGNLPADFYIWLNLAMKLI